MGLTLVTSNVQVITIHRIRLTCGHNLLLTGSRTTPFNEQNVRPGTMTYCHICMSDVQTALEPKGPTQAVMVGDWYITEKE